MDSLDTWLPSQVKGGSSFPNAQRLFMLDQQHSAHSIRSLLVFQSTTKTMPCLLCFVTAAPQSGSRQDSPGDSVAANDSPIKVELYGHLGLLELYGHLGLARVSIKFHASLRAQNEWGNVSRALQGPGAVERRRKKTPSCIFTPLSGGGAHHFSSWFFDQSKSCCHIHLQSGRKGKFYHVPGEPRWLPK